MAIYDVGTASLAADGAVTGVGTTWRQPLTLIRVGATMIFNTTPASIVTIAEIISDTEIRVFNDKGFTAPTGTQYSILAHDGITVQGLAQDVAETLRYYQSREIEVAAAVDAFNQFDAADFEQKVTNVNNQSSQVSLDAAQVANDKDNASQSATLASQEASNASTDRQLADAAAEMARVSAESVAGALVGSFQEGVTLNSPNQQILNITGNSYQPYIWGGALPKQVPANSTPESTGGIGENAWIKVGEPNSGENNLVLDFNAIGDYSGEPLYDGNDISRILFTDNTESLRNAFSNGIVENGTLKIYIPSGHYGFSGEKIIVDPAVVSYQKVIIHGDGIGLSVLDYVKEDDTGTGNTETGDNAKELIRFEQGFLHVEFRDVTLKCTTKRGFVNGTPSSDPSNLAIYNGTIWFTHIKRASHVRLINVEASYANYRCVSIDGFGDATRPAWTTLYARGLEGHDNTGSGFWLRGISDIDIADSTLYRNGTLGVTATGYGISFSQYCGNIKLKNVNAYENYRKGIDKHGGLGNIDIEDCILADNIMFNTSYDHQYSGLYPSTLNTNMVLTNCSMLFGVNTEFCNEALSAIDVQYRNHFTALVNDKNINGTPANRLNKVTFNNCNVEFYPGVTVPFSGYNGIVNDGIEVEYNNLNYDISNININRVSTASVYTLQPFVHNRIGNSVKVVGGNYNFGDLSVTGSAGTSNSLAFTSVASSATFIADKAVFDMTNAVLIGSTGAGNAVAFGGKRKINGCTFKIRDLKLNTHNFKQTAAMRWLESAFFVLPSVADSTYGSSNTIGLGDCNTLWPWNVGVNAESGKSSFSMANKTTSSEVEILTLGYDGNFQLSLFGTMSHAAETYRAWWGSSLSQNVITGATTIGSRPTIATRTVKYNGADTNFTLYAIVVYFAGEIKPTATYNVEVSFRNQNLPPILGLVK